MREDLMVLSVFTYSYDGAGNRTGVEEKSGDRVTWSYDAANQLTREQRSGAAYDVTYSYDEAGNRKTKLEGGTTTSYSYDAANQLNVEYTPASRTTYSYDANGNTQVSNADDSLTTYSWDIENRMTKAELPAGTLNTISYDGDGKRRSLEDSSMLRNFLWDGQNISYQTGSDGSVNRTYTYRPSIYGELVSQSGEFHHYDGLGSTDMLTDVDRDQIASYRYRAFGEQTVTYGSSGNRFTWVGRLGYYHQPDTSDYWLRARVHRPQIGRFLSRDPVRQANLYIWPGNSPVVIVDPSGTDSLKLACPNQPDYSCYVKPPWGYWRRRGLFGPRVRVNKVYCDCKGSVREERNCWADLQGWVVTPAQSFPLTSERRVQGECGLPPLCLTIFMRPFPRELPRQSAEECLRRLKVTERPYGCDPQKVPSSIDSQCRPASFLDKWPKVHRWVAPELEAAGAIIKLCCRGEDYDWIDKAEGLTWRDQKTRKGCQYGHPSVHAAGFALDIYNSGDSWDRWRKPPICLQKVMEFFGWYHGPRMRVWEGHEFSYAFRADPKIPGSTGDQPHFQSICYWP